MKIPEPVVATPQAPVVEESIENEVVAEETTSKTVENEPTERKKKYDFNNLLGKIKEFLDNVE
jgi:cell division protein FtsA